MQASIRRADRHIVQVGQSLGERDDCDTVELTEAQADQLRELRSQPNGGLVIAVDGTISALPVPAPPEPTAAELRVEAAIDDLLGYVNDPQFDAFLTASAPSPAQQLAALKSTMRAVRTIKVLLRALHAEVDP